MAWNPERTRGLRQQPAKPAKPHENIDEMIVNLGTGPGVAELGFIFHGDVPSETMEHHWKNQQRMCGTDNFQDYQHHIKSPVSSGCYVATIPSHFLGCRWFDH